jgi:hypothetical protein
VLIVGPRHVGLLPSERLELLLRIGEFVIDVQRCNLLPAFGNILPAYCPTSLRLAYLAFLIAFGCYGSSPR